VGIIGTILYFFVFWDIKLYFSAWLQVFFTVVQFYGWWFWNYGDKGMEPKIVKMDWVKFWGVSLIGTAIFSSITSYIALRTSDAAMPFMDSMIFGLSVVAQWFLDRKRLQTWIAWLLVNIISILVYYNQGLMLTTGVYVILLLNTAWGYYEWNRAYSLQK
jgi:nicotinamide mononucleotide transporter